MSNVRYSFFIWGLLVQGLTYSYSQKQMSLNKDSLTTVLNISPNDHSRYKTMLALAEYYQNNNEPGKAIELGEQALRLADRLSEPGIKAGAYTILGLAEQTRGNHQKAVQAFQSAIAVCEVAGNQTGAARNKGHLGVVLVEQGKLSEALQYHKSSLQLFQEAGDISGEVFASNNTGSAYIALGNYPEALKHFFIALKGGRKTGDKESMAKTLRNIASCYNHEGNLEETLNYSQQSLQLMDELGNKTGVGNALTVMAVVLAQQKKHDESLSTFQRCLAIYRETGDQYKISETLNYLGMVQTFRKAYEDAIKYHKDALRIKLGLGDKWGMAEAYICIGKIMALQAEKQKPGEAGPYYTEALESAHKGLALVKEVGAKATERGAYSALINIYTAMGDYKKALEYQQLSATLKDSLMNSETVRKFEKLRTEFEVEKAIAEEKVTQEKRLAEQQLRNVKEQAEKSARHRLELAEERLKKEKAVELERLRFELALASEQAEKEKLLAFQQLENEKRLAAENAIHIQAMADEKTSQQLKDAVALSLLEKEKAAKKRRTEGYLAGLAGLALISLFTIIIIRQRNEKKRALDKAEAAHKMSELELQSLRAQLNPHFMFNSLNAIQDLIVNEKNEKSQLYLARFSKLLRMLLDNASQPFVTIQQELELLELYLSLEKLRIPNLDYSIEIDPGMNASARMIPNMMLQPYIENAIWHGLSHKKGERKLQVRVHENGKSTGFEVVDNGIGRKRSAELKQQFRHGHHSRGMQLLSKRFELLSKEYGAEIQTNIQDLENNGESRGTRVCIDVPVSLSANAIKPPHDTHHYN